MELDLEDFLEEVKFQMTEFDILEEETILGWEEKVRRWIEHHPDKKYLTVKSEDDVQIKIKNEDVMEEIARKFYQAVKNQQEDQYWKKFQLL